MWFTAIALSLLSALSSPDSPGAQEPASAAFDLKTRRTHWAWQPLDVCAPPSTSLPAANPVDQFIRAALERNELSPAEPADRRTLIRRLYFDLIGLPPTPGEIEAFLADTAPDACGRLVERLLHSPHFGERWGRHWLDAMRYAETMGHEFDYPVLNAWRYRDYVIRALNDDLPYNQFMLEHLAGDLLPDPRRQPVTGHNESIAATSWFWLTQQSHSPVDVRAAQIEVIDNQLDVMSKAFLGMTVSCARCHHHKFDAISTEDYYALYGILKSSRYAPAPIDDLQPFVATADLLDQKKTEARQLAAQALSARASTLAAFLSAGAKSFANRETAPGSGASERAARAIAAGRDARHPLHPLFHAAQSERGGDCCSTEVAGFSTELSPPATWRRSGFVFAGEKAPDFVLGTDAATPVQTWIAPGGFHSATLAPRIQQALRSPSFTITNDFIHVRAAGMESRINIVLENFTLIRAPIYGELKLVLSNPSEKWFSIPVRMWKGRTAYVEAIDATFPDPADSARPGGYKIDGWFYLRSVVLSDDAEPPLDRIQLWERDSHGLATSAELAERYAAATLDALDAWAADAPRPLSAAQAAWLTWLADNALWPEPDPPAARSSLDATLDEHQRASAGIPPLNWIAAIEDGSPLDEAVLIRGNHRTLGSTVARRSLAILEEAAPACIHEGSGRLELARQWVSTPLAARVAVNRIWHHLFGTGLVPTLDNFGVLGEKPSHPELLDWLAGWFRSHGYSTKELIRLLVLSHTYQMAGHTEDSDFANARTSGHWFQSMPVRRLEAETIRDAILAVSGTLDRGLFGAPVPVHLTPFMEGRGRPGTSGPQDGHGRRSIYLEVRRNFLPPFFLAFDFPLPQSTVTRRHTSNVPAQSLILMNSPFVAEQAARWSRRAASTVAEPEARIAWLFETALGRPPQPGEQASAAEFLDAQRQLHQSSNPSRDRAEESAWADLCHALFNLKEFIFIR